MYTPRSTTITNMDHSYNHEAIQLAFTALKLARHQADTLAPDYPDPEPTPPTVVNNQEDFDTWHRALVEYRLLVRQHDERRLDAHHEASKCHAALVALLPRQVWVKVQHPNGETFYIGLETSDWPGEAPTLKAVPASTLGSVNDLPELRHYFTRG